MLATDFYPMTHISLRYYQLTIKIVFSYFTSDDFSSTKTQSIAEMWIRKAFLYTLSTYLNERYYIDSQRPNLKTHTSLLGYSMNTNHRDTKKRTIEDTKIKLTDLYYTGGRVRVSERERGEEANRTVHTIRVRERIELVFSVYYMIYLWSRALLQNGMITCEK